MEDIPESARSSGVSTSKVVAALERFAEATTYALKERILLCTLIVAAVTPSHAILSDHWESIVGHIGHIGSLLRTVRGRSDELAPISDPNRRSDAPQW